MTHLRVNGISKPKYDDDGTTPDARTHYGADDDDGADYADDGRRQRRWGPPAPPTLSRPGWSLNLDLADCLSDLVESH